MMSLAELAERLAKDAERAKAEIEKDRQYYREHRERWRTVYNPRKQAKRRREDA
jgi:hypothetical protein